MKVVKKPQGCTVKKRRVRCPLGDLAAGATVKVKLVLRAQRAGKFKVKANVTSAAADANPANNARSFVLRAH